MSASFRCLLASLAALAVIATAHADDTAAQAKDSEDWTVTVAPYLWAASIEGTVAQPALPELDVSASFGDIWDHLDIALMGVAQARKGRFGLFADAQHIQLSAGTATPAGLLASSTEVTVTTTTVFGAASWRAVDTGELGLDVMAGLRWWSSRNEITFTGGALNGRTRAQTETWVDPTIGLGGSYDLGGSFFATGWAMAGGFGAGSRSAWDVMAGLGYEVGDNLSLIGGYRALSVDYENDGFVYDVVQAGPLFGLAYSF